MSFQIIKKLGSGSYGTVYHVKNIHDDNEYALKVIRPIRDVKNIYNLTHFKELDILKRIDHPNILNCIDFYFKDPTVNQQISNDDLNIYLLLPLAKNSIYGELADNGLFRWETAVRLMYEMLSAIKILSDNRIFHLDLKLDNILLYGDNRDNYTCKISDFGQACYTNQLKCKVYDIAVYAIYYRAPEIFNVYDPVSNKYYFLNTANLSDNPNLELLVPSHLSGHDVSIKSVIFALGVVFYEIIAGTTFIPGENIIKRYLEMYNNPIEFDNILSKITNVEARNLIRKMVEWNPANRPSLEDIIADSLFINHGYTQIIPGREKWDYLPRQKSISLISYHMKGKILNYLKKIAGFTIMSSEALFLGLSIYYRINIVEYKYEEATIVISILLAQGLIDVSDRSEIYERILMSLYEHLPIKEIIKMIIKQLDGVLYIRNLYTEAWSLWSLVKMYPYTDVPDGFSGDPRDLATKIAKIEPPIERENRQSKDITFIELLNEIRKH